MPEGHTIHRLARDHSPLLVGKAVAVSSPQGRFSADAALIDGQVLERIEPYGKHLFHWWANGLVGHVHLGLYGKFRVHTFEGDPPPPVGAVRMRMVADGAAIDLVGPTACTVDSRDVRDGIVRRLGPDPLRRGADGEVAVARMRRSRQPIGTMLLDQSVIAGVGNVYRAEALFVNGIRPTRPGNELDDAERWALWTTLSAMLRRGVKEGRIVTVDRRELAVPRGPLRRGEANYVYHRDVCLRCGTPVRTVQLGGRPCWYCPTCQPV